MVASDSVWNLKVYMNATGIVKFLPIFFKYLGFHDYFYANYGKGEIDDVFKLEIM